MSINLRIINLRHLTNQRVLKISMQSGQSMGNKTSKKS